MPALKTQGPCVREKMKVQENRFPLASPGSEVCLHLVCRWVRPCHLLNHGSEICVIVGTQPGLTGQEVNGGCLSAPLTQRTHEWLALGFQWFLLQLHLWPGPAVSLPPTQDSGSMPASPGAEFGMGWGLDSLTLLCPG